MSDSTKPVLALDHVGFTYDPHLPETLHDVSLTLMPRSFTVIVGPSGSGKSTILSLAAGLTKPTKGTLARPVPTRMVFQSGGLLPWRTALENVKLGLPKTVARAAGLRRAHAALAELGIGTFKDAYPRDLSGGQRQRVGLARALVALPGLLLLDEPFSALDAETTEHLTALVEGIFQKEDIAMLMVSHSIEDAVLLADEIVIVADGRITEKVKVPLPRPRRADDPEVRALMAHIRARIPAS